MVECDEGEQLPRIVAKLCHRALRDLDKRWSAGEAMRRSVRRSEGVHAYARRGRPGGASTSTSTRSEGSPTPATRRWTSSSFSARSAGPPSEHGEGVLLLLDEMQFLSRSDLGLLSKAMHQISQEVLPVLIAGAGLPQLPLMLKEDKLYAERLFTFRTIGSLSPPQAAKALTVPATRENVSYAPDALHYILEQSQGYPYFLQQWGEAVWNEAESSPIGVQDALAAHEPVTDELDRRFFRDRYDTATEAERIYMAAMADLGPGSHSSADIAARMGLTAKGASVRRDGLLKKGLIYSRVDTELDFTVPQFAAFIERIVPIRRCPTTPTRTPTPQAPRPLAPLARSATRPRARARRGRQRGAPGNRRWILAFAAYLYEKRERSRT